MSYELNQMVICVKGDVMGRLSKGQMYAVSKVKDERWYDNMDSDVLSGHFYYGVNGSTKVYKDDKFLSINEYRDKVMKQL